MPIISLSSFKGGVSKTTSAICLASLFCDDGATLVIDADPNRSATTWARPGGLPFQVCGEKEAAKLMRTQKFEFIIFDTPARPNDVEVEDLAKGCDLLIVPTPPDLLGMDAMALMAKSLPPDTNWKVLLTMIPPPPQRDGEENQLSEQLKTQLPENSTTQEPQQPVTRSSKQLKDKDKLAKRENPDYTQTTFRIPKKLSRQINRVLMDLADEGKYVDRSDLLEELASAFIRLADEVGVVEALEQVKNLGIQMDE